MSVNEMIAEAWKAVKDAGVPEALQEVAFKEAMAVLTATSAPRGGKTQASSTATRTPGAQKPKPRAKPAQETELPLGNGLSDDQLFDKFSEETSIPRADLEELFFFDNGRPILNGTTRKLGENAAAQSRTIAIALTAAYHYALGVRDVPAALIAAECKRKNCYDVDNHSAYMTREKAVNFVGQRGSKLFRVKSGDATIDALKIIVNTFRGVPVA